MPELIPENYHQMIDADESAQVVAAIRAIDPDAVIESPPGFYADHDIFARATSSETPS